MIGKNLKYFRLVKKMSKKDLAKAVNLTPMAITHYENDERMPDISVIRKIAEVLEVRFTSLIMQSPQERNFSFAEFRKCSSLSLPEQDLVKESIKSYCERFLGLVDIMGNTSLPNSSDIQSIEFTERENTSVLLREKLGFAKEGPINNLIGALENKGILVIQLENISSGFSGINGRVDGIPFIAIKSEMTTERKRSTIVHELAHIFVSFSDEYSENDKEKRANEIAGAFLFPEIDVYRELGIRRTRISNDMYSIAVEYGISMQLLAMRAHQLNVFSDSVYKSFMIFISQKGWRKNEPSRIEKEEPGLFQQLIIRAISEEEISIQKGVELYGASYEELEKLISL